MPATPATNRSSTPKDRRPVMLWLIIALVTAFPLVIDAITWGYLGGDPFAWIPNHPSIGLAILLIPVLIGFYLLGSFGYMVGTGILTWYLYKLMLRRQRPAIPPALLVPVLCDVYIFIQALPFLDVPRGAQIRPMGWVAITLLLASGLTIYGVSYAALRLGARENKIVCVIGMLVGLLPIPIMLLSLQLMAAIKGFGLEP